MHEFIHGEGNECITMELCSMDELKNIIKRTSGSYEECSLYIKDGKIDAIQSYEK